MSNGVNDWLASVLKPKDSKPIIPNSDDPKIGMGRLLNLESPITLRKAIEDIKSHIGIKHLRVGIARHKNLGKLWYDIGLKFTNLEKIVDSLISTAAICAGSGASLLNGIEADLYLTGEMLHHDVLEATQKEIHVILCNHSDSERGYLKLFQTKLQFEVLNVHVSKQDKDCLTTI